MASTTQPISNAPPEPYRSIYAQVLTASATVGFIGTQKWLQKLAEDAMPTGMSLAPDWKHEWGPAVWKRFPDFAATGPDNIWFASTAKNVVFPDGTFDCCLVSFAGSALFSPVDWIQENFAVSQVDDFDAWTAKWLLEGTEEPSPGPGTNEKLFSAEGTGIGMFHVLNTKAPRSAKGAGKTFVRFLKAYIDASAGRPNTRIILAGYSLGGTIASALALGFAKVGRRIWGGGGNRPLPEIITLPFACASAGNGALAAEFNAKFPIPPHTQGLHCHNRVLYNALDIVPQPWSTDSVRDRCLDNICYKIYTRQNTNWLLWKFVKAGVDLEKEQARRAGTAYVPFQGMAFNDDIGPAPGWMGDIWQLAESIVLQHTLGYAEQLGLGDLLQKLYEQARKFVLGEIQWPGAPGFVGVTTPRLTREGDPERGGLARKPLNTVMKEFPVLRKIPPDAIPPPPPPPSIPPPDGSLPPGGEFPYDAILRRRNPTPKL